jgi:hypothetical protein
MKTPTMIWQHGAGGQIECPAQALLSRPNNQMLRIAGVAGSTNWLHYPLMVQQLAPKRTFRLSNLLLRYRCDSKTALITNIALFDADECIFKAAGLNLCAYDWEDFRLVIDQELIVKNSLRLSIGVRFDGADYDTHALEINSVGVEMM